MGASVVIITSVVYVVCLFWVAHFSERQARQGRSLSNNPYVYALSLSVYCTAWTYYGSVGKASTQGLLFLTIYIGPTLVMPLWWVIMRKIMRISKTQGITTIADFVSARYGKRVSLGVLVTVFCVVGLIPYISLQIKAIAQSYYLLAHNVTNFQPLYTASLWQDEAFYLSVGLAFFTILFGTRSIDTSERHEGLVVAVALEAIIKLVAFLAVGLYVVFGLFNGLGDVFRQAQALPAQAKLLYLSTHESMGEWFFVSILSALAVMFLPRQFQVAVVENQNEHHLKKAIWLFPLYLWLINIFVLPIALAGNIFFANKGLGDNYVLLLPLINDQELLALLVYLGGFSAAMSMMMISSISLSVMVSNHLVMPLLLKVFAQYPQRARLGLWLLYVRRVCILGIILLAYLYFKLLASNAPLVSIGLISFVAIAQFAPAILLGIFWKRGTYWGAMGGILAGFVVWFCTLVMPSWGEALCGMGGRQGLEPISHAFFWSMLINVGMYLLLSFLTLPTEKEQDQAHIFVDIFKHSTLAQQQVVWRKGYMPDVQSLMFSVLGEMRSRLILADFEQEKQQYASLVEQNHALLLYVERVLASAIGSASAHILVEAITQKEEITQAQVLEIVLESQEIIELNHQLAQQKAELEALTDQLKRSDHLKNEFISTVTHELRTPLTSIRAFSEILADNPELEPEQHAEFLETIIAETQRMERLINQVLELEKFESGKQTLHLSPANINEIIREVVKNLGILAIEQHKTIYTELAETLPVVALDKDRMVQVLINLLGNALKFTPKETGEIYVRSRLQGNEIVVEVQDNGSGVLPALQGLIFEKFYQVEEQNIRKPKGSGLGLAICKQIIQYHGGKIWVESEPEKNYTKFSFTLLL